ncbi:MAG: sugar ABC transporter permease [Anaerolineales bacterium]|nr:sugar ABC transporter permease [Anaerolineales bacterium]
MASADTRGIARNPRRTSFLSHKAWKNLTIFLFLLPAFVLFFLFIVYPITKSVYFSFFSWKGFGDPTDFVGLENFQQILKDKIFHRAIINGLLIIGLSLSVQLPLSLGLAIMVGRDLPGRAFFRMIFFMPYVISEVITAIAFMGLYNPDPTRGLFNAILILIPGVKAQAWLGNMQLVMPSLFVVLTWKYFGLHMLLFLAGLQGIPIEVEEAARIDGANGLQLLRYITIPMLGSTIRTSVYLSILGSLQQFILVWIMTKGGPVNASEVMATYMYRFGFVRFWYGYGSAVAIVMLLISLVFSIGYLRIIRQPEYLGGE